MLQKESTPMVDVINDWLIVSFPCVSQLCYAKYAAGVVEAIQQFIFHLSLAINGLRAKVGIPRQMQFL